MALEDGADLENAVFIFAQAGSEFVVEARGGEWEYYFSEEYPYQILVNVFASPGWDSFGTNCHLLFAALVENCIHRFTNSLEWLYLMECY